MKVSCISLAVLTVGLLLNACSEPSIMDHETLTAGIGQANQQWMAAVEKGDAAGVAAHYTEDAHLMAPNMPTMKGRAGVKTFMEGAVQSGVKKIKLNTAEVQGDGNRALETGTYQIMASGDAVVDEGKYVVEWKNIDGKWYFHRDIFNSNKPAARPMAQKDQDVWVYVYKVKADKREAFESFVRNQLYPAIDRTKPEQDFVARQTRFIAPLQASEDGSYQYMFIMDPVIEGGNYEIDKIIKAKHGEEEGSKMMKEFDAMLLPPYYHGYQGKQTDI